MPENGITIKFCQFTHFKKRILLIKRILILNTSLIIIKGFEVLHLNFKLQSNSLILLVKHINDLNKYLDIRCLYAAVFEDYIVSYSFS